MGPSDSLLPARSGYLFPAQVEASFLSPGPQGLPSSWSFFRYAPSPSTPESPLGRLSIILPKRFWFHPLWEPDHSRFTFRGRFRVRFRYGSHLCLPRLRPIAHAVVRSVGYMSLILFYMANSFHLARTPRFLLAHHKRHPSRLRRAPAFYSVSLLSRLRSALEEVTAFCVRQRLARSSPRLSTAKAVIRAAGSHLRFG
jgi:hypothetical protein